MTWSNIVRPSLKEIRKLVSLPWPIYHGWEMGDDNFGK